MAEPQVQPEPEVEGLPGPGWLVVSFVAYVVFGYLTKSLVLNWIVGPLWLLFTLHLIPRMVRYVGQKLGGQ